MASRRLARFATTVCGSHTTVSAALSSAAAAGDLVLSSAQPLGAAVPSSAAADLVPVPQRRYAPRFLPKRQARRWSIFGTRDTPPELARNTPNTANSTLGAHSLGNDVQAHERKSLSRWMAPPGRLAPDDGRDGMRNHLDGNPSPYSPPPTGGALRSRSPRLTMMPYRQTVACSGPSDRTRR